MGEVLVLEAAKGGVRFFFSVGRSVGISNRVSITVSSPPGETSDSPCECLVDRLTRPLLAPSVLEERRVEAWLYSGNEEKLS